MFFGTLFALIFWNGTDYELFLVRYVGDETELSEFIVAFTMPLLFVFF